LLSLIFQDDTQNKTPKDTRIAAEVAAAAAHYLYIKKRMRGREHPSARIRERHTV
jgi:hypothetical protein